MYEDEFTQEESELRNVSPLRIKKIKLTFVMIGIISILSIAGVFLKEDQSNEPWWSTFAIGGGLLVIVVSFGLYFWKQAKHFISNGVVTSSDFISSHRVYKRVYRINLEYEFDGESYRKAINGDLRVVQAISGLGEALLIVDPSSPIKLNRSLLSHRAINRR